MIITIGNYLKIVPENLNEKQQITQYLRDNMICKNPKKEEIYENIIMLLIMSRTMCNTWASHPCNVCFQREVEFYVHAFANNIL